jgi:hypothetical protein
VVSDTRLLVTEAVLALRVHSATRYSWFGRMSPRLPPRITSALTARTARDYLVHTLALQLYSDFYLRGHAEAAQWPLPSMATTRHTFERSLSAANRGRGYRDDRWQVRGLDGDRAVVGQGGLELTVSRHELLETGGGEVAVGSRTALQMPKELLRIAPGFYTACGDAALVAEGPRPLLRLYWNLTAAGAAAFVAEATGQLNAAGVPFRLKVLHDPGTFSRCDAGVVYLHDEPGWHALARALHARLSHHLRPRTPVFTRPLAPGLAMAHDTGTSESFGQHRCRLLADALVAAHDLEVLAVPDVLAVVDRRFASEGVDLDAAYHGGPAEVTA